MKQALNAQKFSSEYFMCETPVLLLNSPVHTLPFIYQVGEHSMGFCFPCA